MDFLPDFCRKRILVLGVGNVLLGDDGFGPNVIEYLNRHYTVPDDVGLIDAGTGVRKILFTLALSETRPEELVIVDAVNREGEIGQIIELPLDDIPFAKLDDFSMHQAPSSNLLRELRDQCGVRMSVFVCNVGPVEQAINGELSPVAQRAVPTMGKQIAERFLT